MKVFYSEKKIKRCSKKCKKLGIITCYSQGKINLILTNKVKLNGPKITQWAEHSSVILHQFWL